MADKGKEPTPPGSESDPHEFEKETPERAKEKGKAPAVEVENINLMDLKPTDLDKPLEVKVYRKWMSKNVPDPNPTGLCFILLGRHVSDTLLLFVKIYIYNVLFLLLILTYKESKHSRVLPYKRMSNCGISDTLIADCKWVRAIGLNAMDAKGLTISSVLLTIH